MQNFANVLLPWNIKLFWKSYSFSSAGCLFCLPLIIAVLLTLSVPANASIEAQDCSSALAQPLDVSPAGLASKLKILIWNIEKTENSGWDSDLRTLGAQSDLILIQEASVQAMIATALPQHLFRAYAIGYINSKMQTGVLTLSTVEPSLQCKLTAWEPWLGTPKATNITEYPLDGLDHRLLVINLHAINFSFGLVDFESQVKALEPLLTRHTGPLIVAGDFNTWSDGRSKSVHNFMASHQLAPVAFEPDLRTVFWNSPLDHVYLRGLDLVEASTIEVESSDHNPLSITVEIPTCVNCTAQLQEPYCTAC